MATDAQAVARITQQLEPPMGAALDAIAPSAGAREHGLEAREQFERRPCGPRTGPGMDQVERMEVNGGAGEAA